MRYNTPTLALLMALACFNARAELTIWTSSENIARALKLLTPAFEKEFSHKVKVTILNKDLTSQFKTAAISGKGPDIFCWAHDVVGELASSGLIEPINLSQKQRKEYFPSALKSFTYNDRLYGYPYDVESIAIIRNKDLAPKPFKTFEELYQWSLAYKQRDTHPFLFDIKNFYFNYLFLSTPGGYIFGKAPQIEALDPKNIGLSNQDAIAGISFLNQFVAQGIIPTSSNRNVAFEKMLANKLAITIDGPWAVKDLIRAKVNFSVDPLPQLAGKDSKPFIGTHGFIIRRSSQNKLLAKELIEKYFMTPAALVTIYQQDPRGPSKPQVLKLLKTTLDPESLNILETFAHSAANGDPMPNITAMGPVWSSMGTAFEHIFQKGLEPKNALNKAKNTILKNLPKESGEKVL